MNPLDYLSLGIAVASLVYGIVKVTKSEQSPHTPGTVINLTVGLIFIVLAVVAIAATVATPLGGGWWLGAR